MQLLSVFETSVPLCHRDRDVYLNALQPLTCSNRLVKKKKKEGILKWMSNLFALCSIKRKAWKRLSCLRLHQLTSLPHCVSRLVLRLSSANVSDSIWVSLGPSFLSPRCSFRFLTGEFKREIYGVGRTPTSHTPRPMFRAIAISAKKAVE